MPGPAPKPAHLRQRRNKKPTAATVTATNADTPNRELPPHPSGDAWHPLTLMWWGHVWSSAIAERYVQTDADGLFALAILKDRYWLNPSTTLMTEIRLQEDRFMLSPRARAAAQVEFARADEAEKKRKPVEPKRDRKDPRIGLGELRAVK